MIMFDEYEKGREKMIMMLPGDFLKLAWCVWGIELVLRLNRDKVARSYHVIPNRLSAYRYRSENSSILKTVTFQFSASFQWLNLHWILLSFYTDILLS
jgi:hypothetical protein